MSVSYPDFRRHKKPDIKAVDHGQGRASRLRFLIEQKSVTQAQAANRILTSNLRLRKAPMEFPIQCECGRQVVASEGMAGARIGCVCGRQVAVPSLSEMRSRSPRTHVDEAVLSAIRSDEPLRQPSIRLLYGLAFAWMCLLGLPLGLFSFSRGGPVAGSGALLLVGGHVWLFTQIFAGNPAAALVVLLVPLVGPFLALQFIVDHFRIARWPVLCQFAGLVLFVGGMISAYRLGE